MWDLLYDKLADFAILASLGGVTAMWRKSKNIDKKFQELDLELAKNYVTKPELKIVEDKLDHLSETMATKIDRVNDNLLLLLRTPNA